jgi:anthranilate phosphoribosyltransferase
VTPRFQVAGAYSLAAARVMAGALAQLGVERALVVHGAEGWDEATPLGPFVAIDVRDGACVETVRDPLDLGIARCAAAPLRGGDATGNARRLRAVLEGTEHGAHRDAVVLNTALVLEVTGCAASAREGVSIAREALDRGEGEHVLWRLLEASPRAPTPPKGVARV